MSVETVERELVQPIKIRENDFFKLKTVMCQT